MNATSPRASEATCHRSEIGPPSATRTGAPNPSTAAWRRSTNASTPPLPALTVATPSTVAAPPGPQPTNVGNIPGGVIARRAHRPEGARSATRPSLQRPQNGPGTTASALPPGSAATGQAEPIGSPEAGATNSAPAGADDPRTAAALTMAKTK